MEPVYLPYSHEYASTEYRHLDPDGRLYKETDVTAAKPGGDTEYDWPVKRQAAKGARWEADLDEEFRDPQPGYEYKSVRPYRGRYWAFSKDNLIQFAKLGYLIHRATGAPRLMQFGDEMPGVPLQDLWDDIPPALGSEILGYPTQKPNALLERIVRTSSNDGDVVLDPFCGCGTAIAAAEKLGRTWIGIDITHLAINLIRHRLEDAFGGKAGFKVVGEPQSLPDARTLAAEDPYSFQWWALGLVGARPVEQKKGADHGIDGRLFFHDDQSGRTKQVIISVKAGHTGVSHVRDLRGVLDREQGHIGVLISLQEATQPMRTEAAGAGFYNSPWGHHPRLQVLTVPELLDGKSIDYPRGAALVTFKKAALVKATAGTYALPLQETPA